MTDYYYLSLQYSAIQKTVLRHDRLWSIAGISNILSRINEIELPIIVRACGGTPIVAGGGKFTARFPEKPSVDTAADTARLECERHIATTLPMLEFQVTRHEHKAISFKELAANEKKRNRAIEELNEQKRQFRGYAVSFNPHLKLCEECQEYPAQKEIRRPGKTKDETKKILVCRVCHAAYKESGELLKTGSASLQMTTLQRIYARYLDKVAHKKDIKPAADFNDMFQKNDGQQAEGERNRMAVWFSDLNNMNDKVPIWLEQNDENNVLTTFSDFRELVVKIIVDALERTYPAETLKGDFLPFRLVVAGGDDLCLVTPENYILDFTKNLSNALVQGVKALHPDDPLTDTGLSKLAGKKIAAKPFGFGASFVVTSVHTPFRQIHALGEELMSEAKKNTDRQGNSVNWRVMAEDRPIEAEPFSFHKPLFIESNDAQSHDKHKLSFNDYLQLRKELKGSLSGSHLHQIVGILLREKDAKEIERQLKILDSSDADKSFSPLLQRMAFRNSDKSLNTERIATILELLTIGGGNGHE